jgi:hypothetical protein
MGGRPHGAGATSRHAITTGAVPGATACEPGSTAQVATAAPAACASIGAVRV